MLLLAVIKIRSMGVVGRGWRLSNSSRGEGRSGDRRVSPGGGKEASEIVASGGG